MVKIVIVDKPGRTYLLNNGSSNLSWNGLIHHCAAPAERERRSREEEDKKVPDRHVLRRPRRAGRLRLLLQHC